MVFPFNLKGPRVHLYGICDNLYKPQQVLKQYSIWSTILKSYLAQPFKKMNQKHVVYIWGKVNYTSSNLHISQFTWMYAPIGIIDMIGKVINTVTFDIFGFKYQEVSLNPSAWHLEAHNGSFGLLRVNCNIVHFWEHDWLKTKTKTERGY